MTVTCYANEFGIGDRKIKILEYKGQRVMTLTDFCLLHDNTNATKCYYNQRNCFDSKDHFLLEKDELKTFRQKYSLNTYGKLHLFTYSGYERLTNFAFIDELDPTRQRVEKEYYRTDGVHAVKIEQLSVPSPHPIDAEALAIGMAIKNLLGNSFKKQLTEHSKILKEQQKSITELQGAFVSHTNSILRMNECIENHTDCINSHKENLDYLLANQRKQEIAATVSSDIPQKQELPTLMSTADAKKKGWYCAKELAERLEIRNYKSNKIDDKFTIELGKHLGVLPPSINTDVVETENYAITVSSNHQRAYCIKRKGQDKYKAWFKSSAAERAAFVQLYRKNARGHKAGEIYCEGYRIGTSGKRHIVSLPPSHRAYALKNNQDGVA